MYDAVTLKYSIEQYNYTTIGPTYWYKDLILQSLDSPSS